MALALLPLTIQAGQFCLGDINDPEDPHRTTPDSRLTDNGDETVTDELTGLMWKQCSEGQSGAGCATDGAGGMDWQAALNTAVAANAEGGGVGFAGYTDWRLPNLKELTSIVERGCDSPSINENYFPVTASGKYWSSSSHADPISDAWYVNFESGSNFGDPKSYDLYVRLVRGGL